MDGENRPPRAAELAQMRDLLRAALREGARGFSTGLSYTPGCFADKEELVRRGKLVSAGGKATYT